MPAILKLIRFPNLIIIFLVHLLVRIFLIGPAQEWMTLLADPVLYLISLSVLLVAAGGYIINDYYDIKIDVINKPERVVVGRFMKRRTAMLVHLGFSLGGILLGLLVSWRIGLISVFAAFLLWLYSNQLKRLPLAGNVTISFLTSLAILVVAFHYKANISLVVIFAAYAFFISLIREIIKDMEDMRGDARFGCKTLPILIGIRRTKLFIYVLMLGYIYILISAYYSLLAGREKSLPDISIIYILLFILFPLLYLWFRLFKADTVKDYKNLSFLCKLIMISGALSMIFI